jgi:YrbI family 3-deoxy-D-manno-octulosonate 8-phosphate phosphatase
MPINDIKLIVTDVDGVLTDSGYTYDHQGNVSKRFNTRDFFAINFIKNVLKIPVMGLSGASDHATIHRFKSEDIPLAYGISNKLAFMNQLTEKMNISFDHVAFIGDHWIDIPVLQKASISFCPLDAVPYVKNICKHQSGCDGGDGVIDDFVWQFYREEYEARNA